MVLEEGGRSTIHKSGRFPWTDCWSLSPAMLCNLFFFCLVDVGLSLIIVEKKQAFENINRGLQNTKVGLLQDPAKTPVLPVIPSFGHWGHTLMLT